MAKCGRKVIYLRRALFHANRYTLYGRDVRQSLGKIESSVAQWLQAKTAEM
jgi:hypothetical protein